MQDLDAIYNFVRWKICHCLYFLGSTDFGNVSQVVPCILPAFDVGKKVHIHSADFHTFSGTEEAMGKSS